MHMQGTPRSMQRRDRLRRRGRARSAASCASASPRCEARGRRRASASSSTRASASARRRRTTSSCWRASASCSRSAGRCSPAGRASRPWRSWSACRRRAARTARPAAGDARRRQRRRGSLLAVQRGARDRARARRRGDGRGAGGLEGRARGARIIAATHGEAPVASLHEQNLLRHRRHPRHGRHVADHAGLHAAPRPCGRPGAEGRRATADGADRQGHADLGLHDRVGAGGRASPRPASTCC